MVYDYKRTRNSLEFKISDCINFRCEAIHNDYQGGDAGHGGRCSFFIGSEGGDCFEVNGDEPEIDVISVSTRGDAERRLLAQALIEIGNFLLHDVKESV